MSHWYDVDGEPRHFQEDGKATNLRHARKQELYPSVTTILGIVDKYNLNLWLQRETSKETLLMLADELEREIEIDS